MRQSHILAILIFVSLNASAIQTEAPKPLHVEGDDSSSIEGTKLRNPSVAATAEGCLDEVQNIRMTVRDSYLLNFSEQEQPGFKKCKIRLVVDSAPGGGFGETSWKVYYTPRWEDCYRLAIASERTGHTQDVVVKQPFFPLHTASDLRPGSDQGKAIFKAEWNFADGLIRNSQGYVNSYSDYYTAKKGRNTGSPMGFVDSLVNRKPTVIQRRTEMRAITEAPLITRTLLSDARQGFSESSHEAGVIDRCVKAFAVR